MACSSKIGRRRADRPSIAGRAAKLEAAVGHQNPPEDRNNRAGMGFSTSPLPRRGEVGGTRSVSPSEGFRSIDKQDPLYLHIEQNVRCKRLSASGAGDLSPAGER